MALGLHSQCGYNTLILSLSLPHSLYAKRTASEVTTIVMLNQYSMILMVDRINNRDTEGAAVISCQDLAESVTL